VIFVTQIPAICDDEDDNHCHHNSKQFPCITFTSKDMQVKRKHDRPLCYTGYIGSFEVSRIQVDPRSVFSIMPCRVCCIWESPPTVKCYLTTILLAQRLQSPILCLDDNKAYEVIWY